jgi:triosephosphate isomerase
MHKNPQGTTAFFQKFLPLVEHAGTGEVVICPTLLDVENAVHATRGTRIEIGAQNLYWENEGAFTGEVSGSMIKASGCSHVIVGHSERRHFFGETDEQVLEKTVAALAAELIPIVCIGERDRKEMEAVITEQFRCGIGGLTKAQFAKIVIAYEPIWAIGDGQTATPEVAAATHQLIRAQAKERFGADAAREVRILYGGSVKPDNARSLGAQPGIDGFLIGGASLDPVSFAAIVNL